MQLHLANQRTRSRQLKDVAAVSAVSRRHRDRGVIITLVAVFMLAVIGAMAALSIDVVTLYTARSEAQLAADAGALAGARAFANSGVTSDPRRRFIRRAITLVTAVATQVASQNVVGGRTLNPASTAGEIVVTFPNETDPAFDTDPQIKVQTRRTDLPTFFARIWGSTQITVVASATAEAYNPSGANRLNGTTIPVAPICVKPWLLPNLDPTVNTARSNPIFDATDGSITANGGSSLVGQSWGENTGQRNNTNGLSEACGDDCSTGSLTPSAGQYYPGTIDAADFPAPSQGPAGCSAGFTAYQLAVAGCVQKPIACGSSSSLKIDTTTTGSRDTETFNAVSCLIHYNGAAGDTDSIDRSASQPPFQFLAGSQNPIASAVGKDVLVSYSLVTIPVIDTTTPPSGTNPSVTVIGFLQVFLNPSGDTMPAPGFTANQMPATIVNLAGCGNGATGQPIVGNGASPVAARLISP